MTAEDKLKLFHMSVSLINTDMDAVEEAFGIDLGRRSKEQATPQTDEGYYLQFEAALRKQASEMARHYQLFYCLENSIRRLVSGTLESSVGSDWWEKAVSDPIRTDVAVNIQREQDAGVTLRSPEMIDYTTFGQLSNIIEHNWDAFADTLNNKKAVIRILAVLNQVRGPIAHCSPLAADEVVRLHLAFADWFRVME